MSDRLELLHFWKKRVSFTRLEDTAPLRLDLGFLRGLLLRVVYSVVVALVVVAADGPVPVIIRGKLMVLIVELF